MKSDKFFSISYLFYISAVAEYIRFMFIFKPMEYFFDKPALYTEWKYKLKEEKKDFIQTYCAGGEI